MEQLQDKIRNWLDNEPKDHFEGIGLLSHLTTNRMLIRNLSRNETAYKRDKLIYELEKYASYLPSINTPPAIGSQPTDPGRDVLPPDVDKVPLPVDLAGRGLTEADLKTSPGADPATGEFPALPLTTLEIKTCERETTVTREAVKEAVAATTPIPPKIEFNPEDAKSAEQLEIAYSKMFNKKGILINGLRDFKEHENEARKVAMEQIGSINRDMEAVRAKLNYFKEHGSLPRIEEPKTGNTSLASRGIPDDPVAMQKLLLNERSTVSKIRGKLKHGNLPAEKAIALEAVLKQKTELVNEIERRLHGPI